MASIRRDNDDLILPANKQTDGNEKERRRRAQSGQWQHSLLEGIVENKIAMAKLPELWELWESRESSVDCQQSHRQSTTLTLSSRRAEDAFLSISLAHSVSASFQSTIQIMFASSSSEEDESNWKEKKMDKKGYKKGKQDNVLSNTGLSNGKERWEKKKKKKKKKTESTGSDEAESEQGKKQETEIRAKTKEKKEDEDEEEKEAN